MSSKIRSQYRNPYNKQSSYQRWIIDIGLSNYTATASSSPLSVINIRRLICLKLSLNIYDLLFVDLNNNIASPAKPK